MASCRPALGVFGQRHRRMGFVKATTPAWISFGLTGFTDSVQAHPVDGVLRRHRSSEKKGVDLAVRSGTPDK